MKKQIQSYALDEQNALVHAKDVDKGAKAKFYCVHCHEEMICRQGHVRTPHFAHKSAECSYDQYLHSLAKRRICEWFNQAESVKINIPLSLDCSKLETCKWLYKEKRFSVMTWGICRKRGHRLYDLKRWYHTCEEERDSIAPNGRLYRADIFCNNNQNPEKPLFIEICVTHPCEPEKIESGLRIIEITVESEDDIDQFIGKTIRESDKVRFYGFHPNDESYDVLDGIPIVKITHFPSGKIFIDRYKNTCLHHTHQATADLEIAILHDIFNIYEASFPVESDATPHALILREIPEYRSCAICRWSFKAINKRFCKYNQNRLCSRCNPCECSHFIVNQEKYDEMTAKFDELTKDAPVNIWRNTLI